MACGPQMVGRVPPAEARRQGRARPGITADGPCLDPRLPPDRQRELDEASQRGAHWLVWLGLLAVVLAGLGLLG
jgi:hypothetical protein